MDAELIGTHHDNDHDHINDSMRPSEISLNERDFISQSAAHGDLMLNTPKHVESHGVEVPSTVKVSS